MTAFDICISVLTVLILSTTVWVTQRQLREFTHQTQLSARTNHAQVYQSIASEMIGIDTSLLEHWHLAPYFYDNVDPPAEHRVEATRLAEIYHDFLDLFDTQKLALPEFEWPRWHPWIEDLYRRSPVMREFFRANGWWYRDIDFCRLAKKVIREVDGVDVDALWAREAHGSRA